MQTTLETVVTSVVTAMLPMLNNAQVKCLQSVLRTELGRDLECRKPWLLSPFRYVKLATFSVFWVVFE